MLPENDAERIACTFFMIASGILWTFIISTAAGIAATLDPNAVLFHTTMDQLNCFMRERALPKKMRQDLRKYFEMARQVREVNDDSNLLANMSPLLQGRVALAANRHWLQCIWYLSWDAMSSCSDAREFVTSVAKSLIVIAYVAEERAPIGQLYILRKGMCVKNWNFMRAGRVCTLRRSEPDPIPDPTQPRQTRLESGPHPPTRTRYAAPRPLRTASLESRLGA
jgi:hypothetical protein